MHDRECEYYPFSFNKSQISSNSTSCFGGALGFASSFFFAAFTTYFTPINSATATISRLITLLIILESRIATPHEAP